MGQIVRKKKKEVPGISTASLPDIVFMLLFFFMVVTKMKEVTLKVEIKKPGATQAAKITRKDLVSNIFIGKPLAKFRTGGSTTEKIQLDDSFRTLKDIGPWIESAKEATPQGDRDKRTVSLKVDKNTPMGIVTDVKETLRDYDALKIQYSTRKEAIVD